MIRPQYETTTIITCWLFCFNYSLEEQKTELKDIFGTGVVERIAQYSDYSDLGSLATSSTVNKDEFEIVLFKKKKVFIERRQKIVEHIGNKLRTILDGLGHWDPLPQLTMAEKEEIQSIIGEYSRRYGLTFLSDARSEGVTVGPLTFANRFCLHTVPGKSELQGGYLNREFTWKVIRLDRTIVTITMDEKHIAGCMLHLCYLLPRILDLLPLWEEGCHYEVTDMIEVLKPCFTGLIEVRRDVPEAVAVLVHGDVARQALGL